MEYSIGVDIGGTKIAGGLVDQEGHIHHRVAISTPKEGRDAILQEIKRMVADLAKRSMGPLRGIGVGTAGQVDFVRGKVLSGTSNIADWNDVPIREWLSETMNLPIFVDNDVNVMVVAETQLGVAKGYDDVVCLSLGTGVGGGVLSGGKMMRGVWGGAGELGHISVNMEGPLCNCGMRGCLETYASGPGIRQRYIEMWESNDANQESVFANQSTITNEITSRDVFQKMKTGDQLSVKLVQQMLKALSTAIVGMNHAFNPSMVVLGGGLMEDGEWICDEVSYQISHIGMRSLVDPVKIRKAKFGSETTLVGAALQCWFYE